MVHGTILRSFDRTLQIPSQFDTLVPDACFASWIALRRERRNDVTGQQCSSKSAQAGWVQVNII